MTLRNTVLLVPAAPTISICVFFFDLEFNACVIANFIGSYPIILLQSIVIFPFIYSLI